jgi:hypothetical protein
MPFHYCQPFSVITKDSQTSPSAHLLKPHTTIRLQLLVDPCRVCQDAFEEGVARLDLGLSLQCILEAEAQLLGQCLQLGLVDFVDLGRNRCQVSDMTWRKNCGQSGNLTADYDRPGTKPLYPCRANLLRLPPLQWT